MLFCHYAKSRHSLSRSAGAVFLLILCSCGGGSSSGGDSGGNSTGGENPNPPLDSNFRITTFNTGLLPSFAALTDERVQPVAAALAALESDVVCVQEVWRQDDLETIRGAIGTQYPFQYVIPPRQKFSDKSPVCRQSDVQPVFLCLAEKCLAESMSLVDCAATACKGAVFELGEADPQCASALFAQAGRPLSDLFFIQEELFSSSARARLFAFDGSSGLLLASRIPLENAQALDFYEISTTSRRAALFATVTIDDQPHHIGCTHLTSNLDGILPYTGTLTSWENEARTQAEQMISFAGAYAQGGREFLAGDFNCSIANANRQVEADFSENCEAFLSAGYRDPAAENLGCTFCGSNPLVQQNSSVAGIVNTLLDHVFVKQLPGAAAQADIVLNQNILAGGQSVPPSDHYGVRLAVSPP